MGYFERRTLTIFARGWQMGLVGWQTLLLMVGSGITSTAPGEALSKLELVIEEPR